MRKNIVVALLVILTLSMVSVVVSGCGKEDAGNFTLKGSDSSS